MTVTVWHKSPRELYRVYDGIYRVAHYPDQIDLFGRDEGGDFLVASVGPLDCWAIDTGGRP